MKKIAFLIAITAVTVSGCQKIKSLANISFNVPFQQNITIPAADGYSYGFPLPTGGVALPFPPVSVATNAQQYFDQYHASRNNIVSTYLSNLSLQITAPAYQNFDFLDTIQIYLSSESLQEVLVAYAYNIPKGVQTINLAIVPGLNLKNYADGDSITTRLNAHINAVPAPGTALYVNGQFRITANPL